MLPTTCPPASTAIVVPTGAVAASRNSTSVASAKLRPSSSHCAATPKTSRNLRYPHAASELVQSRHLFERDQRRHIRQCGSHSACRRRVARAAGVRVDPGNGSAATRDFAHRARKPRDLTHVKAVADHDREGLIVQVRAMFAHELTQALPNSSAAAPGLTEIVQTIGARAGGVAQRAGDLAQLRAKKKGARTTGALAESISKLQHPRRLLAHRTAAVQQQHESRIAQRVPERMRLEQVAAAAQARAEGSP